MILLANLSGICTSLSRKTATTATATTAKNIIEEKINVATQRKIDAFILGFKNLCKNLLNICFFSFKYFYLTYYHF
jgi:hypothetical protein